MIDIASALWAIELEKSIGTDEGSFLPVMLPEIKDELRDYYINRRNEIKQERERNFTARGGISVEECGYW